MELGWQRELLIPRCNWKAGLTPLGAVLSGNIPIFCIFADFDLIVINDYNEYLLDNCSNN